jgi:predicted PurR-regulated permease PerM
MSDQKPTVFSISTATIVKVILTLAILYFVYIIRDIISLLVISLILAILIDPLADWFEKRKIPRTLAVLLVYLVLISLIGLFIALIIPPLTVQFDQLTEKIPFYWEKIKTFGENEYLTQYDPETLQNSLKKLETNIAEGLFTRLGGIVGGAASLVLILFLTFYIVIDEKNIKKMSLRLIPAHYQLYVAQIASRMKEKMGAWLKGQLILCLIIGVCVFLGLTVLGVDYALVLGLIAGMFEIIPYLGPWMTGILVVFIAFGQSPTTALFAAAFIIVLQALENNLIVPKVMQKAVGLNPIISILAIITGAKIAGIIGVALAIPVASALSILLQDFFKET